VKSIKKLFLVAGVIFFLMLQPVVAMADGDDDPPHGRPEMGGDTVLVNRWVPMMNGKTEEGKLMEQTAPQTGLNALEGMWIYIDMVLNAIR